MTVTNEKVKNAVDACYREAELAKTERMALNRMNFDAYHLRQDYSHKKPGQSREFLPKQAMGTEQTASFLHQGLMDLEKAAGVVKVCADHEFFHRRLEGYFRAEGEEMRRWVEEWDYDCMISDD